MNFNYGIMNREVINDLEAKDETRTFKIDGWTKYRVDQIAKEYEVQQCVVIKAFVQAMLKKYEYDNNFDIEFEDRNLIKENIRLKKNNDRMKEKNGDLNTKIQILKAKLNKYQ